MFMPTVISPNNVAIVTRRRVGRIRHGRRQAASTSAPAAARSQATVAGCVVENRNTPIAAPRYCDAAPVTKTKGTDHRGRSRCFTRAAPDGCRSRSPGADYRRPTIRE
jgi:hypothetical protein